MIPHWLLACLLLLATQQQLKADDALASILGKSAKVHMNKDLVEDVGSHLLAGRLLAKTQFNLVKIKYCGAQNNNGTFIAVLSSAAESIADLNCAIDFSSSPAVPGVAANQRAIIRVVMTSTPWILRLSVTDAAGDGVNATSLASSLKGTNLDDVHTDSVGLVTPNSSIKLACILSFVQDGAIIYVMPADVAVATPQGLTSTPPTMQLATFRGGSNAKLEFSLDTGNALLQNMPNATVILQVSAQQRLFMRGVSLSSVSSNLVLQGLLESPFKGWACKVAFSPNLSASGSEIVPTQENCEVYSEDLSKKLCQSRKATVGTAAKNLSTQLSSSITGADLATFVRPGPYSIDIDHVVLSKSLRVSSTGLQNDNVSLDLILGSQ